MFIWTLQDVVAVTILVLFILGLMFWLFFAIMEMLSKKVKSVIKRLQCHFKLRKDQQNSPK